MSFSIKTKVVKRDYDEWLRFCEQVQNSTSVNLAEDKATQTARIKKALKDYNYFVKNYFPKYADADCADFHIISANAILKDPKILAVLEWPREHAKSVHSNIIIPMWLMAHGELNGMILMGKSEDDACNLLSDIQAQLQFNELYAHDFGESYNFGSWANGDFTTKGGIRFLACGRKQSPRGVRKGEKRPNYAVCDDVDDDELVNNPRRVKEVVNVIMGALFFALETKRSRLVIAGNRIHNNSVLANIVGDTKPNSPKREGIYHSKIFAIDPKTGLPSWKRYTLEDINQKIKKAGPTLARREFFHENHIEGAIFKDEMICFKKTLNPSQYKIIVGYFDPSFENKATSDFKAVRVWGLYIKNNNQDYEKHCLKSFVRRAELQEAFRFMSQVDDNMPQEVGVIWYVERQFFNRPIQEALYEHNKKRVNEGRKRLVIITDTRVKENKYTRMVKMEPEYYSGNIFFSLDEIHNPDMIEGNNQLKGIEPGYNTPDDSPDSDEGAWFYLDPHKPRNDFVPIIGTRNRKGW